VDEFLRPYLVIFGTAAVLFGIWWAVRGIVRSVIRRVAGRTIETTRRISPPETVAEGANAWSCGRCPSVNRPEATKCYSCRGYRSEVEHLQGRI
jgi:hypothetical protein